MFQGNILRNLFTELRVVRKGRKKSLLISLCLSVYYSLRLVETFYKIITIVSKITFIFADLTAIPIGTLG